MGYRLGAFLQLPTYSTLQANLVSRMAYSVNVQPFSTEILVPRAVYAIDELSQYRRN